MQKIINYIMIIFGAIGAVIIAAFTIFYKGKKAGREELRNEVKEKVLNDINKTKQAIDKRANDSIDIKRARVLSHRRD